MVYTLKPGEHKIGVPYASAIRENSINHGFVDLRTNFEFIPELPEAKGSPEMISLLEAINRSTGILWSLGCEKAVSGYSDPENPLLTTKIISYVCKHPVKSYH